MTNLAQSIGVSLFALLLIAPLDVAFGEVTASFRYRLANFSGPVLSQWARLAVDAERNEVYSLNQRANDIRIFDDHGMEIHTFGENFPSASDIAIADDGNIFVLSTRYQVSTLHLCNYRGEQISEFTLEGAPDEFANFRADRLAYRRGTLYLADSNRLAVVLANANGVFQRGYDLAAKLRQRAAGDERAEKKLEDSSMNGFDVDSQGNVLFTVASLFSAFRMSANGDLAEFGRPGSGLGKFGVTGGIAADDMGYVYVADRLRCVVLVFDRNLSFQEEFGYRGGQPSNLIAPNDVAIDGLGNLYVAQAANRGVSVFKIVRE